MTKLISTFIFLIIALVSSAQSLFEKEMSNGLALWKAGKNTEAVAQFERLAATNKNNWLPGYYVSLIYTLEAFEEEDKTTMKNFLERAQKAQDEISQIAPDNPEIIVVQAMIYTAWIVYDPMTNGRLYYTDVMKIYEKAATIAPNNPRVVFNKASFEKGAATYFESDTSPMCEKIKKSIELFATFKPESPFHPTWGLERAKEEAAKCN